MDKYVLGIDFGTDSVRALVINAITGEEEAGAVSYYKRWAAGKYSDPTKNQFRQHPLDYIEGLEEAVRGALAELPESVGRQVVGIGVDTTGSTPVAVDHHGRPLALNPQFQENPNAMFILWKDHTAVKEAEEINQMARTWGGTDFTTYEGGIYSSEWFWAKILRIIREDPSILGSAYSWVEHCDWIPALLTGTESPQEMKRSRCAAGHKAMWHPKWGGLPDEEFLTRLDPRLKGLRSRLYQQTFTADQKAGDLTDEWAKRLGLRPGITVAVGAFDAHMGAVGGGIGPSTLVKIMGTSTCDIMVASYEEIGDQVVRGICGQVDGSVLPGMIGLEAGQSAFGDVYAWLRNFLSWPLKALLPKITDSETASQLYAKSKKRILEELTVEASTLKIEETGLLALDWLNGRRTPDADQALKGAIIGISLGSTPAGVFRALVEATAFGAKAIVDRFISEGVTIKEVIALGGIASKNDFVMQVATDVLNMPIKVAQSEQACALGAGIFGAVASKVYTSVSEAQAKMSSSYSKTFYPIPENVGKYERLYQKYLTLGTTLEEQLRSL